MNLTDVESHLLARIAESKAFTAYDNQPITENWRLRTYPAQAIPICCIEDPETKRVEAWGMRFRVIFGPDQKRFYCDLDVRMRPRWKPIENGEGLEPAYVHICVPGVTDSSISWIKLKEDGSDLGADLSLMKWYARWLMQTLKDDKKCGKFMRYKIPYSVNP